MRKQSEPQMANMLGNKSNNIKIQNSHNPMHYNWGQECGTIPFNPLSYTFTSRVDIKQLLHGMKTNLSSVMCEAWTHNLAYQSPNVNH